MWRLAIATRRPMWEALAGSGTQARPNPQTSLRQSRETCWLSTSTVTARVARRRVGTWRFERRDWELGTDFDIDALEDWLESAGSKDRSIMRASLQGQVSVAQKARLDEMLDHYRDLLGGLEIRDGDSPLAVIPDDADLDDFALSGYAREALSDLSELAESGDRAVAARNALALLYRLTRTRL